jgi:hypothetical protein
MDFKKIKNGFMDLIRLALCRVSCEHGKEPFDFLTS